MKQRTVEETGSFPIRKYTDSSNFPREAANSAGEKRDLFATARKYSRKLRNVNEDMNRKAHKQKYFLDL